MELLPIGVVSARSGMAPSALRYYEEQGLLPAATRTAGGARRYPRTVLRRLAVIPAARNAGVSLPEVRALAVTRAPANVGLSLPKTRAPLAGLPEARPPSARDWERLSSEWRDR